jgi:hypothetical protein
LPVLPLLALYAAEAIPARGVLGGEMMLMVPAMLAAMLYRRKEYSESHEAHRRRSGGGVGAVRRAVRD